MVFNFKFIISPLYFKNIIKKKYKLNPKLFRNTINFYKSAISAPIFPELKEKDIRKFSKLLIDYFK